MDVYLKTEARNKTCLAYETMITFTDTFKQKKFDPDGWVKSCFFRGLPKMHT